MIQDFWKIIANVVMPFVPFVAGLFRYKKMDPDYRSMVFIFGFAFIAEALRATRVLNYYGQLGLPFPLSFIEYNLYILAIGLLYTHFLYILISVVLFIFWFWDHFIFRGNRIHELTKEYRLFYAFLLCLMAIQQINRLVVAERQHLLKNSSFLICCCLLFFFLPYIISEGIFLFAKDYSLSFANAVGLFRRWSNLLVYLTFTIAVLWIPQKKNFIRLS
jgi:hypothetical protein